MIVIIRLACFYLTTIIILAIDPLNHWKDVLRLLSTFADFQKIIIIDYYDWSSTFYELLCSFFRLMTSAGWNDVLESLMIQPPDCELGDHGHSNGNCGSPLLAITYFTSFIIISYMIVINMYIAIILENFNQAHQEEEIGIVEDDLEMFYIRWSK